MIDDQWSCTVTIVIFTILNVYYLFTNSNMVREVLLSFHKRTFSIRETAVHDRETDLWLSYALSASPPGFVY